MDDRPRSRPPLGSDYWRLLTSAAASNLGDGVRLAALPLLAVTLTDEPLLISGVAAATFLPAVLFGPIGGAVIDRVDRRRLMTAGQLLRGLAALLFVALLVADAAGIWAVYVLAIALGVGEVVVDGASQAVIPTLVPRTLLERANARLVSAQLVLDEMAGAALGGLLFAINPIIPFIVDAATFLVGGVAVSTISRPLPPRGDATSDGLGSSMRDEVREGFAFLLDSKLLGGMAASVGLMNLAAATGGSVLVILVVDELAAAEATFGFVLAAGAVAGFVGSLVAEGIVVRLGRGRTLVGSVAAIAAALLVVAFAPTVVIVGAGMALMGFGVTVFNIPGRAVRQEVVPDHLLGRVVSSYRVLGFLGVPLGAVLGGVLTDLADVRTAFVVAAGLMAVAIAAMVAAVRHLPSDAPTDAHSSGPPAAG